MVRSTTSLSALLALALFVLGGTAAAQAKLTLMHTPPTAESLPFPGLPVPLRVEVQGTRDFRGAVRVLAVIDGRLIDSVAGKGMLNEKDRPTFEAELHAPQAEIRYQFILTQPDGTMAASPWYSVQRRCIPTLDRTGATPAASDRLTDLEANAKHLERELQSLEEAIRLTREIQGRIKEVRQ